MTARPDRNPAKPAPSRRSLDRLLLVPLHGYRVIKVIMLFALRGVRFSGVPYCQGRLPRIVGKGTIIAGTHLRLIAFQHRIELGAGKGGELRIGNHVGISRGCTVFALQKVVIEDHARLGDLVSIHDTDFHSISEGETVRVAPVVIKRNAWLARGSTVMPGVTVGEHSVVAAGSIVTKDVPPRTVVAGIPAKPVGSVEASDEWARP